MTVKNTSTNVTARTTTNASGYYDFPVLRAGEYIVSAAAPGLTPTKSSPFNIETCVTYTVQA